MLHALCAVAIAAIAQPPNPPIDAASLLAELTSDAISRVPDPWYVCAQSSSYDRASTSPDRGDSWFGNNDFGQFLGERTIEGRTELVMLDAAGPGAIVRLWSPNPAGTLRVYLDGSPTPAIAAPMKDLLGGTGDVPPPLSVEHSRGFNLLVPIPYRAHCLITTDAPKAGSGGNPGIYFQVNYRTYPPDADVRTFTSLPDLKPRLAAAAEALSRRPAAPTTPLAEGAEIAPARRLAASLPGGPRQITHLALRLDAKNLPQALRSTVVMMRFDGEDTVWAPVGDLFGMGPGIRPFRTRHAAADDDGTLHLFFPMPYAASADIVLENAGDQPVRAWLSASAAPTTVDAGTMRFHATWRQEYPIHTRPRRDWNYATITGTGVFAGDSLSVMNPVKAWWGEGDEKIYVDGEPFPSHFGTGTEDYYGFGWCCPVEFAGAFNAQPRCDGHDLGHNRGRTALLRTRGLDAIPFRSSLRFDMEVWHWEECDVEFAATTYFYALPGATTNVPPDPKGASRALVAAPPGPPPVIVDGAIECEDLKPVRVGGKTVAGPQGGFEGVWSKDRHLWVRAAAVGDFVELAIPAPGAGERALTLYATRSWDYGIVQIFVNAAKVGTPIDLCSHERHVRPTGPIDLGRFAPIDGRFILRVEVVGSAPDAQKPGTFFGLDCVAVR